ncbi:MAG: hypothetical protein JNM57_15045 [Cyclobacteriaceae bacterium]|nr:hypothetical protein [Cyclobacteriaceae bacterium]
MSLTVTLFYSKTDDIKITVEARFEGESLVIEGYDIGKRVKEYWGDSDYEYSTTIQPENVLRLYALLHLPSGDKNALLQALADRFHTNSCYSEIQQWLHNHQIPYQGFSWA